MSVQPRGMGSPGLMGASGGLQPWKVNNTSPPGLLPPGTVRLGLLSFLPDLRPR